MPLELNARHKAQTNNAKHMNIQCKASERSCRLLPYIFDRDISLSANHSFKRKWLRNFRAITLSMYFLVWDFWSRKQLFSTIHLSKLYLMPVTFYPSGC